MSDSAPARPLRSGPRLPMRGGIPATPTAGRPIPMAKRTKTLVGLDIDATGIVAASVAVNGRAARRARGRRALEPGIIRDGEVARRRRPRRGARDALPRRTRASASASASASPTRRSSSASSTCPTSTTPRSSRPPSASTRRTSFRCRSSTPCSTTSRSRSSTDETGRRQRVLLVAARRDMVERVLAALRGAGLQPEGVDLSAFAMVRALHRAGPRTSTSSTSPSAASRTSPSPAAPPAPSPAPPAAASRPSPSSWPSAAR